MTKPTNAIEVVGLTKRYGKTVAIDNISFTAKGGEVLGVLGPNCSGKTTLIGLLGGIIKANKGKAFVAGIDVVAKPGAVRRRAGIVSDLVQIYDDLSVERNLILFGRLYGLKASDAKEKAEHVISLMELEDNRKDRYGKLPIGVRKKALVASAIVHDPEVLLLDEATAELDPHAASLVRNYVSSVSRSGRTVVWTSNVPSEVERICSRMLILSAGRIVADDRPQRFTRGIAGTGTVDITISGIKAESVTDILESLSVSWEMTSDNEAHLTVENNREALDRIFTTIVRMGASVLSVEGKKPTLEEAYHQVVGDVKK